MKERGTSGRGMKVVGSDGFLKGGYRPYSHIMLFPQGLKIYSPESGATEQSPGPRGTESVSAATSVPSPPSYLMLSCSFFYSTLDF